MTSNLVSNPVNDGKVTSRSANIHVMKSDLDQVLLSNINNEIVGGADNDINTGQTHCPRLLGNDSYCFYTAPAIPPQLCLLI
ncbi:unnamed protein product [Rotaria socialis]|uniref:Uncharacterized protein n=1 Tax=Rotaria socialis TaxID=392032 RepID=A0A818XLT8_9BILA|nr:unnamed protein product [Rotaria socialis]